MRAVQYDLSAKQLVPAVGSQHPVAADFRDLQRCQQAAERNAPLHRSHLAGLPSTRHVPFPCKAQASCFTGHEVRRPFDATFLAVFTAERARAHRTPKDTVTVHPRYPEGGRMDSPSACLQSSLQASAGLSRMTLQGWSLLIHSLCVAECLTST